MRRTVEWNFSKLASLLLILVVFLVILLFLINFGIVFKSKAETETCRSSVLAQSVIMEIPFGKGLIPTDCKTYDLRFFEDHVEVSGNTVEVYDPSKKDFVKKFNGLTNDIVNGVLAEELRKCWYQYLEGKKPVIDRKNWASFFEFGKPNLCVICDDVSFDRNVRKDSFTSFYEFTKEKTMRNSNLTYYNYYAEEPTLCTEYNELTVNCWEAFFANQITKKQPALTPQNTIFSNKEDYSVVFIMHGLEKKQGIGSWDMAFFSYVLPKSILPSVCDKVERGSPK